MYHLIVNVNLVEESVIQVNDRIAINVDVCVKNVIYVKNIIFGILLHVFVEMENIWQLLWMIKPLQVMKL